MTGAPYSDTSDGIIDNGEFISWDWINENLRNQDLKSQFPHASLHLINIFEEMVELMREYHHFTGRHLPVHGTLGELYAEAYLGIKLHKPYTPGSDGKFGNDYIEIKTITPEKGTLDITVKTSGNFNKLLIVKINSDYHFDAVLIDRKSLMKKNPGKTTNARISWDQASTIVQESKSQA